MADLSRGNVSLPSQLEAVFRSRMGEKYGKQIPGIAETPLGLLMRFAVLREMGVSVQDAERSLHGLSRGNTRSENIRV